MKILMIKTSSLGDIIHLFPVIHFLKREFPEAKIDWVVEKNFADIVKAHPAIHKIIEMDSKGWRKKFWKRETWNDFFQFKRALQSEYYDVVIDLQGNTKSALPTFFSRSSHKVGFGLKTVHEWPNILVTNHRFNPPLNRNVREENLYVVQHYFQRFSRQDNGQVILALNNLQQKQYEKIWAKISQLAGKKILVCPGSAWKNKQISMTAWYTFLQRIQEDSEYHILLAWGTDDELALVQSIQQRVKNTTILERVALPLLQNLMCQMELVIAMDSLPLHLAGVSSVPTFSVFGASSSKKYKPLGDLHGSVQGNCPYGKVFERRCSILRSCPTGQCIRGFSGDQLYQEWNLWKKNLPSGIHLGNPPSIP